MFKGWRVEVTTALEELKDVEDVFDPYDTDKVLRPRVPQFQYKAFVRNNTIMLEMPYVSWEERGNDDYRIRQIYQPEIDKEHVSTYLDSMDGYRKKIIKDFGVDDYQTAKKVVHIHLYSSEDPQREFDLVPDLIELNDKAKEKHHMRLHMMAYDLTGEEYEDEDEDDGEAMTDAAKTKTLVRETQNKVRLNYYVADRGFNVKHAGEDYFEKKEEV